MRSAAATRLLEEIDAAWHPFLAAVQEAGERIEQPTPAGWTAKELLAHVAFWDETLVPLVQMMLRGEPLPDGFAFGSGFLPDADAWPPPDVHNAREAAWARDQRASDVLARLHTAHESALAVIATLSDDEAARTEHFPDPGGHYREHLPELEALLQD